MEGVRLKKTELQHFLKLKAIDVCFIQETHLSSSHGFFIRGYKVFRQDRENRPKGGLLTLVRNNIPAAEIQRSSQADLDTEYLGVKLVLAGTPVTVFNIYSPPDKQIQLHNINVEPQSRIIPGDFNSNSPSWGYEQLNNKGEVENWITENRLILINKPDDPDAFYSRTWRTTSTPDLAITTDDIQGIAEREVSSQLIGSDHRPVIISIKGQTQPHRNQLPVSWNYLKKANWDAVRKAVDRKTAALELPVTNISDSGALFKKAVLEAAKMFIPRGRCRDYQPYWTPELDNFHKALDQQERRWKARQQMQM